MSKRKMLISLVGQTKDNQIEIFKKMYANGNMEASIEDVVKNMRIKQVDRAIQQVERTIEINKQPEKKIEIKTEAVPSFESLLKREAIMAADNSFRYEKENSIRAVVGGQQSVSFKYKEKEYQVDWDGYWEKSDWYDYHITGNGVDIRGTRYFM